jgi:Response regulators consisting of a CheY-like receiver domain and a winged-helix DNA-binding domain
MTLTNLSVQDSKVGSSSSEAQQEYLRRGVNTQTSGEAFFDEAWLRLLDEQPHGSVQLGPFQGDNYQIALVPRWNCTGRTGPIRETSPKMDRVLLLPLTWRELLDRLHRKLNHASPVDQSMITAFGEVRVNFLTMVISRSGKPVVLTTQEFKLLGFLIKAPERVFSRNELLDEVWGYDNYPSTRTVDNHICRLRQKLEPTPARPIHFLTVHGMGYKFVP